MAPKRVSKKQKLLGESEDSIPLQRKRQKLSGSVDVPLNPFTAISWIDLEEEQEQFLRANTGKVSTSPPRVVQKEEEEMFLSRSVLQGKLENIISRYGLKILGEDVEHCLLLGLAEMLHRLITNMIRMSKQRVDCEKKRHCTLVTSDIHRDIIKMSEEARNLKKPEVEESNREISDGEIDKCAKLPVVPKVNKKKIGVSLMSQRDAANKAIWASLGGDDLRSKWQLMSKKLPQKEATKSGAKDETQQDQVVAAAPKRVVSIKDLITILEREPQMLKSSILYCLYEKSVVDAIVDEHEETAA